MSATRRAIEGKQSGLSRESADDDLRSDGSNVPNVFCDWGPAFHAHYGSSRMGVISLL